jgi:hypothetical protein
VSGCGLLPGDSDGTPRERFSQAVDDVRSAIEAEIEEAVEQAKEQQAEQTGDIGGGGSDAPRVDAIRTDTNTAFDYDEYTGKLEQVITSLERFWAQELPQEFGVDYSSPARYVYYRPDEGSGPRCGSSRRRQERVLLPGRRLHRLGRDRPDDPVLRAGRGLRRGVRARARVRPRHAGAPAASRSGSGC